MKDEELARSMTASGKQGERYRGGVFNCRKSSRKEERNEKREKREERKDEGNRRTGEEKDEFRRLSGRSSLARLTRRRHIATEVFEEEKQKTFVFFFRSFLFFSSSPKRLSYCSLSDLQQSFRRLQSCTERRKEDGENG